MINRYVSYMPLTMFCLSFLLLLPPFTYFSAIIICLLLGPILLGITLENLRALKSSAISLPQIASLTAVLFLVYALVRNSFVQDYELAFKETIVLSLSVCFFSILVVEELHQRKKKYLMFLVMCVSLIQILVVLSQKPFITDIWLINIVSKNPTGVRLVFLIVLNAVFLMDFKNHTKLTNFALVTFCSALFYCLILTESIRAFIFLLFVLGFSSLRHPRMRVLSFFAVFH